jgi:hypothetical protein
VFITGSFRPVKRIWSGENRTLRNSFTWVSEKKNGLFCLFGASRKATKKLPNGQKRPTDNKNIQKNGF